jgi:septal ring factor EnvC (AmiA/AmiB activator)
MKQLPLYLALIIGIMTTSPLSTIADVSTEQVRQNLEQSRNMLLRQEDDLKRSYLETVNAMDTLNKQLEQLNTRKISIEQALQRNNQTLKDMEYSLRKLN